MKKELLTISLTTLILLSGCGKVEDNSSKTDPTKGNGANAIETVTDNEDHTNDEYYEKMLSEEHKLIVIGVPEGDDASNKNKDKAIKLMLEAIAQPETEKHEINSLFYDMPFNGDFELRIDFENEVSFKVGDTEKSGNVLDIIKCDEGYYFGITKKTEEGLDFMGAGSAIEFDSSYIPKIVEVLSQDENSSDVSLETHVNSILKEINYVDLYCNGYQDIFDRREDIVRLLLSGIYNTSLEENALDTDVYCMNIESARSSGFLLQVSLCRDLDIWCADENLNGNIITLIKYDDNYYFEVDEIDLQTMVVTKYGPAVNIDSSYAQQIMELAGVTENNGQNDEVLTPENIENYQFGFELYNDGHKDCWEKRYACAKLMLEAIAQPGTDMKAVDLTFTPEQHNDMETKGFMTWLKFENDMNFKVGDTIMSGSTFEVIKLNDGYYFYIGTMDDIQYMYEFDSAYIDKIMEAAVGGTVITGSVEDPNTDTENKEDFYKDLDLSETNMIVKTSGTEYLTSDGSDNYISDEQKEAIVRLILDRLSDTYQKSGISYLHEDEALSDPSGMYLLFDFGQPTDILVSNLTQKDIFVISLAGNAQNGFDIQVNNDEVYKFDDDIADKIREILAQ